MEDYIEWLDNLKKLMIKTDLISEDVILCPEGYKPYFDDGKTPYETMRAEFGNGWVKLHQKWFFTNSQQHTQQQK